MVKPSAIISLLVRLITHCSSVLEGNWSPLILKTCGDSSSSTEEVPPGATEVADDGEAHHKRIAEVGGGICNIFGKLPQIMSESVCERGASFMYALDGGGGENGVF